MPWLRQIRLAVPGRRRTETYIEAAQPDWIHIATEGPVGWSARAYCLRHGYPFTTSYHALSEYAQALLSVPVSWGYRVLRQFHAKSAGMMVATPSLQRELSGRGFPNILPWTRGVDVERFHPPPDQKFRRGRSCFPERRPRIAGKKSRSVPGRGTARPQGGRGRWPASAGAARGLSGRAVHGTAAGRGAGLRDFASADVFVFPSRTDTFGLVILEAMASGLPVAAYPAPGPSTSWNMASAVYSTPTWRTQRLVRCRSTAQQRAAAPRTSAGAGRRKCSSTISVSPKRLLRSAPARSI